MAIKVIDITSKLTEERPVLKVKDEMFQVDDRKNTVIALNQELTKEGSSNFGMMDKIIKIL
jgi:hypothetical protein